MDGKRHLVLFCLFWYTKKGRDENCLPQTNGIRYQWKFFSFFFENDFSLLFISSRRKFISVWCWKCIFILLCQALRKYGAGKCTFDNKGKIAKKNKSLVTISMPIKSNGLCTIASLRAYEDMKQPICDPHSINQFSIAIMHGIRIGKTVLRQREYDIISQNKCSFCIYVFSEESYNDESYFVASDWNYGGSVLGKSLFQIAFLLSSVSAFQENYPGFPYSVRKFFVQRTNEKLKRFFSHIYYGLSIFSSGFPTFPNSPKFGLRIVFRWMMQSILIKYYLEYGHEVNNLGGKLIISAS